MLQETFINDIKVLLMSAKNRVKTAINIAMVYTYYEIGRRIVEQEQKGSNSKKVEYVEWNTTFHLGQISDENIKSHLNFGIEDAIDCYRDFLDIYGWSELPY